MRLTTELLALSLVAGCPSSTDSDQARYPQQPQPEYTYQAPQQQPQQPQQPYDQQQPQYRPQMHAAQLGVAVQPMTSELRSYFGAPPDRGVLVARVMPGSAADRGGIRVGDVVTAVNNRTIDDVRDLRRTLAANQGPTVDIQLVRQGQAITLQADLTAEPMQANPML